MNLRIAPARTAGVTSPRPSGRRLADKIRFAGGSAITLAGAVVSLSDLAALLGSVG